MVVLYVYAVNNSLSSTHPPTYHPWAWPGTNNSSNSTSTSSTEFRIPGAATLPVAPDLFSPSEMSQRAGLYAISRSVYTCKRAGRD